MNGQIKMNLGELNGFVGRINAHGDQIAKGLTNYTNALDSAISFLGGSLVQPLTNASESVKNTQIQLQGIVDEYSEALRNSVTEAQTLDTEGASQITSAVNQFYP